MMEQALESEQIDEALDALPNWRHAGEFLVRVVSVADGHKGVLQQQVQQVETDPERCSFTDTAAGIMIYLGDQAGEGISAQDLETAAKIDSVLAHAS
jgi:pterin-4a-carbinolamine dehydratase